MSIYVTANYLDIEWQEPGLARRVEVGPEPVEIEQADDGSLRLEVQIFPGDHAWLGLRLSGVLSRAKPAWNAPDGQRHPLIVVEDGDGARWWVPALTWDDNSKRHLNAFYRSLGIFEIVIGKQRLDVVAVTHGRSRLLLEDYLHDFRDDLIWLVLGFDGIGTAANGIKADDLLATAIASFTSAFSRTAKHPAGEMREVTGESRVAKLRPNAATFRQHARTPAASQLPGRVAEESANIADNRFLRHMAAACIGLAQLFGQAAKRQADAMENRARIEADRAADYRQIKYQSVDPGLFDRQLTDLKERLELVEGWSEEEPISGDQRQASFPIQLTGAYGKGVKQFFYVRSGHDQLDDRARYRVVDLPRSLAASVFSILHFSKDYVFRGVAKSSMELDSNGNPFRMLKLKKVSRVEARTKAIENKQRKRIQLEKNKWYAPLKPKERAEYQQAARTAEVRRAKFREMADRAAGASTTLLDSLSKLRQNDIGLQALGIGVSPEMPTSMRFSVQPDYAACLSAYRQVQMLAERSGLDEDALEGIERISTLHASALYERWCLVKILTILIADYGFLPPRGWQEQLIAAATGLPHSFSLALRHPELSFGALFEMQPLLRNGRRPDFRLRFAYLPPDPARHATGGLTPSDLALFTDVPGLVMDAKFRTRWSIGEPMRTLESLASQKRYDCEGDRIFVLHPVAGTVITPSSPLEWAAHCDYGHDPGNNHRRGTVWLAPDAGRGDAQLHLRRLIGLELQASFLHPIQVKRSESRDVMLNVHHHAGNWTSLSAEQSHEPVTPGNVPLEKQRTWISPSFCLSCGKVHTPDRIIAKPTLGRRIYWQLGCSACEMVTTRTHCYGQRCTTTLFKNNLGATYHRTIANQPTHVVCPSCGAYFDEDWSDEDEHDETRWSRR
jgi:ribosomal protein L32